MSTATLPQVRFRPLGDRVLAQRLDEGEQIRGGIIIPDSAKEKPQEALIVALGSGKRDDNGNLLPFSVKEGDSILISKYGGTEVKLDGEEFIILREDDILGVIEK